MTRVQTRYSEDWCFTIVVERIGEENRPEVCRPGLEPGGPFSYACGTPAGFCSTSFTKMLPGMTGMRCGGDLGTPGGTAPSDMVLELLAGVVRFCLTGYRRAELWSTPLVSEWPSPATCHPSSILPVIGSGLIRGFSSAPFPRPAEDDTMGGGQGPHLCSSRSDTGT